MAWPTRDSTSTSAGGGCSSWARTCSRASPTTSCRWRGSPRRPGSRRRCSTTTSPPRRRTSSPRWRRRRTSSQQRTEPDPELPPLEQLSGSLDAYLGWVEENAGSFDKMIRSSGAVPEVRALLDRVRGGHGPADRRRAGRRRAALTRAAHGGARLARVHGRRLPGLGRAPRPRPRGAARPAAGHAARRRAGRRESATESLISSRSTTKTSVSFGPIAPAARRAVGQVGRDRQHAPAAVLHPATPWSQPGMTMPWPSGNSNGSPPRSHEASNFVPSLYSAPSTGRRRSGRPRPRALALLDVLDHEPVGGVPPPAPRSSAPRRACR